MFHVELLEENKFIIIICIGNLKGNIMNELDRSNCKERKGRYRNHTII